MRIGEDAARGLELRMVRHLRGIQGLSRAELARRMDLAPSTVGLYVDRLIDGGFLREGRKVTPVSGRPPTVLGLNPEAGHFVGVDFEGRQFWVTAVDFAQQPISSRQVPIHPSESAESVLLKAEEAIASLVRDQGPLLGIAIGVPGALDAQAGVALHYEYISGWSQLPLRDRFQRRFGVPVALENNIRVMALAEELFGQGRDVRDFVCLGVRSGIAAGIVIDQQLHSGVNHLAGEIGNWPCERGARLEQLASVNAILQNLEEAIHAGETTRLTVKRGRVSLPDVIVAARQGDPLVLDVLWTAGKVIGRVLASMSLVLNPQRIIIAGPLAEFDSEFIRPIRETMESLILPPHGTMPSLTGSTLGEFAGALGGAALAVREWSPPLPQN